MTAPGHAGTREAHVHAQAAPGRVLVVDDSRMNRMQLVRMLAHLGHEAVEAADGREALELLARGVAVDLVLLDLVMPELDGFATLAAIKADPELARIPVLMISGVDELDGIVRCIGMGAVDYLPRPFQVTLFEARVTTSLADKRLRDENAALLATVERQRGELARYISPRVAELVSSAGAESVLAGHRTDLTVAFADLRGFTAFCESADPEEIVRVVREYHAVVGRRVTEYEATLEHYAGDGVHFFFNDPVPQADHPERAVRMVAALRDDVRELEAAWERRGVRLALGVGVALGPATAGRIGFEGRYAYAVLGSTINLAARLSGEARPGQVLLTDALHRAVAHLVDAVPLDALHLKGIAHPVAAWAMTGLRA